MEKEKKIIKQDKILFQINYDEETDNYKYIINELNNKEFLAFVMFLRVCCDKFEDNINDEIWNMEKNENDNDKS